MGKFSFGSARVHYVEEGDGELVVLLPGNTAGAAAFTAQLPVFGARYRTVALDFLGTGRSERRTPWPDDWWGDAARQVEALMDHLDRDRGMLVGTSGGAVVALRAAAAFPDRIGAVVADSFSRRLDEAMLRANVLEARLHPSEAQRTFWQICHGDDWPAVVAADTAVMERLVERGGDWLDVDPRRITAPVLLTGSTTDPAIPGIEADYRGLQARIPRGRVFLTGDGEHPLMWTRPDFFNRQAMDFLASEADHG